MGTNTVGQRALLGTGIMVVVLLFPLFVVIGMSAFLFGLVVAVVFIAANAFTPVANQIQRVLRNRTALEVSRSTPKTRQVAKVLRVPLIDQIRAPEKPIEVIVRLTEGGCPLMRKPGDVFHISEDGKLSSPLCSPSAASVQRLLKDGGLESGSTAHCVCPLGDHQLTFALDAA